MLAAVAFGLGFQWPNTANISGYTRELLVRFVERGLGHYRIQKEDELFFVEAEAAQRIESPAAILRLDPRIRQNGLVTRVGRRRLAAGVVVLGIAPAEWNAMRAGSPGIGEETAALIGAGVAERLKFTAGDSVQVLIILNDRPLVRTIQPAIVSGYGYATEQQILLPLGDFQNLLGKKNQVTELAVLLRGDLLPGDPLTQPGPPYVLRPWWETVDFARQAIEGNRVLAFISSLMTLTGISIPLVALLFMAVFQDREHIALLSSLGFSRGRVFFVYFLRAAFIAIIGCATGALLGYGLIRYFAYEPIYETAGFVIRPSLSPGDLYTSLAVVFSVTILSGVFPAIRAARLDPVVIFRGLRD